MTRIRLVKKFLDGFKMNNLAEKFQNGRIFYISHSFETLKKSLQSDVLEAQIIREYRMDLILCSMNCLEPKLHSENLFGMNKTHKKSFGWLLN